MVGSNKILTVSYGTFSCTLEGFDDSFGTMKAIAEYFRDLAADDRYFGAVPPVPDAEMLARIAEREVARRVEARMEASGIVLRVGQAIDNAATPDTAVATRPAPVAKQEPVAETVAAPLMPPAPLVPRQPEPLAEPVAEIVTPPAPVHADADSVAAKLQRIRAVVGKNSARLATSQSDEDDNDAAALATMHPVDTFADLPQEDHIPAEPASVVETGDDVAAILAEVAASVAAEPDAVDEADLTEAVAVEAEEVRAEEVRAEEVRAEEVEAEEIGAEEEAGPTDTGLSAAETLAEEEASAAHETFEEPEILGGDEATAPAAPPRVRLIKMSQSERDQAIAMGVLRRGPAARKLDAAIVADAALDHAAQGEAFSAAELVSEDVTDDFADVDSFAEEFSAEAEADLARLDGIAPVQVGASTLSADDEAELLAELEAVEREAAPYTEEGEAAIVETIDEPVHAEFDGGYDFDDEIAPETSSESDFDLVQDAEAQADGNDAAGDTDLALMNIMARVAETGPVVEEDASVEEVALDQVEDMAGEGLPGLADALIAAASDSDPVDMDDDADEIDLGEENLFAEDLSEYLLEEPVADLTEDQVDLGDELTEELAAETAADPIPNLAELLAQEADEETEAIAAAAEEDDYTAEAEADDEEPSVAHSHLRTEPEADEAALSRIMSEAEAQLSEPEASRRRESIAQLRAAVAATEAARRLGEAPAGDDHSVEEAFRDDLQQVVRPRRPMSPATEIRSERPRPAPLKLVASQRVDLPQQPVRDTAAPIRPRRVTIATDDEPTIAPAATSHGAGRPQASSFAEFAAEMGATSLSDLLEAAAAYTAFVEGSEDFSRPQLLKKVTQMVPEQFSREDGLRSFGTLLREGRITRIRAGRFQVSEETRFNPERRAG